MRNNTVINALSFDVEDWFHCTHLEKFIERSQWEKCKSIVEHNVRLILEVLLAKKTLATFFVLGWVADRYPKLIKEISDQGHEIATHGWSHTRAYQQTLEEFKIELKKSIDILKDITGKPVLGHRAACFSITHNSQWVIDVLLENGISYDSSIYPVIHDKYGMAGTPRFPYVLVEKNRCKLIEFPPATYKSMGFNIPVAGGGYFRLYPYVFTSWVIRKLNKENHPVMVYLHPPEFDPKLPKLKLGLISSFRVYVGIKNNFHKLKHLLNDFKFAPVKEVLANLGFLN